MDTLIIIAGVLLIAFALYQTVQRFLGKAKNSCCGSAEAVTLKKVEDTDVSHYPYHYLLSIDGMHCSNCAKTVENTLNGMPGVWGRVNLGKKEADVLAKSPVESTSFAEALKKKSYTLTGCKVLSEGVQ